MAGLLFLVGGLVLSACTKMDRLLADALGIGLAAAKVYGHRLWW